MGAVFGLGFFCCCGSGIGFFYWDQVTTTQEIADQLRDEPVLSDQIGDVEKFTLNRSDSQAEPDPDTCVYDAVGSKRDAKVKVKWVVGDDYEVVILWASVEGEDGIEHTITGDQNDDWMFDF